MKKTILFCVALAGLTAMSSCGNKAATKLENAADSASYALGVSNGARFGEALKSGMYEQLKNIDPNDFMKGLAAALKTDSTQRSYEMGLSQGLYIKEMLNNIKQGTGVEIDIPTFVQAYKQAMELLQRKYTSLRKLHRVHCHDIPIRRSSQADGYFYVTLGSVARWCRL